MEKAKSVLAVSTESTVLKSGITCCDLSPMTRLAYRGRVTTTEGLKVRLPLMG
jgi:hypothetical protein